MLTQMTFVPPVTWITSKTGPIHMVTGIVSSSTGVAAVVQTSVSVFSSMTFYVQVRHNSDIIESLKSKCFKTSKRNQQAFSDYPP